MWLLMGQLGVICTAIAAKVIPAILIYVFGKIIISEILKLVERKKLLSKMDETVQSFAMNFLKTMLYLLMIISIISVLGVPMASVITVLASAGVAVGLALQGALGNLAGGIMVMIFRPFKLGDYISAVGAEGTVKKIELFYTVIETLDNKVITIPNGSLMNANVVNFSANTTRRVDLTFACAKTEDLDLVQKIMMDTMMANEKVLRDPEPFARISGGTNEAMEFTVRAWGNTTDYCDIYFELTHDITKNLGEAGIKAPAMRVITG